MMTADIAWLVGPEIGSDGAMITTEKTSVCLRKTQRREEERTGVEIHLHTAGTITTQTLLAGPSVCLGQPLALKETLHEAC